MSERRVLYSTARAVRALGRPDRAGRRSRDASGQALLLLVGVLVAVLLGALVLGGVARGVGAHGDDQRAADLAALAGARAMRTAFPRLFEPATVGGDPVPGHLERGAYLTIGRRAAEHTAALNDAHHVTVSFPDGHTFAPVRIRVQVRDPAQVRLGADRRTVPLRAVAEASLAPPVAPATAGPGGNEYHGPLAYRQGKPMRPDVAIWFDRMDAAAQRDGIDLVINSAYRSNAEQAILFAQHPDPKWVAPPGKSLHRLATELDLGPDAAYGWLQRNAARFHFKQRYSWEPWHYGFTLDPGSTSVGYGRSGGGDGRGAIPGFVPDQYAPPLARAAQRWSVSAALLAAQLYAESNFNPDAVSPAGARGIAQFTPATAIRYGLHDPFDPAQAIDAQAHLMHDLLRRFASVPLALAAYNAGPAPVAACGCVPAYPETQGYVARILGLLGSSGDASALASSSALIVRLVR
jgi:hypothetical protein